MNILITKIWFDGDYLFGQDTNDNIYKQLRTASLLYFIVTKTLSYTTACITIIKGRG